MIKLIDGKGQLGERLASLIDEKKLIPSEDIAIYHTWNFMDKSAQVQSDCYEKFRKFVEQNPRMKTIFTSTYSQTESPYNYFKQLAEAYLLSNNPQGYSVRLPTLIGKGICQKFREEEPIEIFGSMELMSLEDAAEQILHLCVESPMVRNLRLSGEIVSAKLAKRLILYGRCGK